MAVRALVMEKFNFRKKGERLVWRYIFLMETRWERALGHTIHHMQQIALAGSLGYVLSFSRSASNRDLYMDNPVFLSTVTHFVTVGASHRSVYQHPIVVIGNVVRNICQYLPTCNR